MPEPVTPLSNEQLEALVAGAAPDELQRALRIVLGAEQAYWERNLKTGSMWYSPSFFRVLGLPPMPSRDQINARIHPDDRAAFEAAYGAALRGGGAFSYDVRYLDGSNVYRWARAIGRVWIDDTDGQPLRLIGTMIDVHAERQAQLDANEHARRYERALDASVEAHFESAADSDGFFISDNFPRLLGYPAGTPAPDLRTFLQWVHADDREALAAEMRRAASAPCTWESTYRLRQADGDWRWYRGRGRTERSLDGRLRMSGMVGDVHQQQLDRDELAQHRRHLRRMVAERTEKLDAALVDAQRQRLQAERASRAKSEFLAHMSHELRTPLNGLLGLTELALKVAEQPAQQRYLQVALASGRALLSLINEVLDFSRMDAGSVPLLHEPFDLSRLLADVLRSLMPGVRGKGLAMRYDWAGEATWVRGDAARVRQVVTNLAANAAKFTASGHVTLRGEIVDQGGGVGRATVRVEDTGPGIEPAQRQRVFEAFVQADASLTRVHGGTGLGLAIARRLARAMQGDVVLEHSSASGSCFAFSWPVQLADDPAPAQLPARGHAGLALGEAIDGAWLTSRMGRLGWTAELVADAPASLLHWTRTRPAPDLLLLAEQVLPRADELAALRSALPHTRIALLVGPDWGQPAYERLALAQRIGVVTLPLAPRDLHDLLVGEPAAGAAPEAPAAASAGARVLVVEDNPVNRMIAEEFLRQLGHAPSGAADGAAAVSACSAAPPQLVLMDLQMPVMDGFEATRRLRAQQALGQLPRFPILALSAHAGDVDREEAVAAGMDDYLTKPILMDALRSAIERWL